MLHDYATILYSHSTVTATQPLPTTVSTGVIPRSERGIDPAGGPRRVKVGIIGATGYVGAELVRLLARHPNVELVGLVGRGRDHDPIVGIHPHLATTDQTVHAELPPVDAVFIALPHGAAAELVPDLIDTGTAIIDQGPDFRLRDPADYPRWYGFDHPRRDLLEWAVYGLPELHRDELVTLVDAPVAIVGAPGCYPTATLLALAPLARAGLIGDLVVDAKSGVSGAGREGLDPSANPGIVAIDFLPHLVPMTRGILSACHVRPTRPVTQAELDELYADAYANEPFLTVVATPPATKHVTGSNEVRVHVSLDERTGRILAIGVEDNLVKGAAGQAIQAFNLVHGLPETAGLTQLPLAP